MSITKVNDAQIPEDYTRNPEITKVNDTQIHQCTNIDKTYQQKSRKLVKHKFQESTQEIQKSQRGEGLSHEREHENSPTAVTHEREAISWQLTINLTHEWSEDLTHEWPEDRGLLPHKFDTRTGFSLPRRQRDIAHCQSKSQK